MYPRVAPLIREIYGQDAIVSINANFYNANCYAPFLAATLLVIAGAAFAERDTRRSSPVSWPLPRSEAIWLGRSRGRPCER